MGEKRKREDETKEERKERKERKQRKKEKKELKRRKHDEKEAKKTEKEFRKQEKKLKRKEDKAKRERKQEVEKPEVSVDGLDSSQASKFLRLMGAKKNNITASASSASSGHDQRSKALEKQYSQGLQLKHGGNKRAGLGSK